MTKQHQTHNNWLQGAFDTNKHVAANVICLDREQNLTKTQRHPQNQSTETHWCLKATTSHNNGIKTALIPMFKNNSHSLISLSKILFLASLRKHFPNNQLKCEDCFFFSLQCSDSCRFQEKIQRSSSYELDIKFCISYIAIAWVSQWWVTHTILSRFDEFKHWHCNPSDSIIFSLDSEMYHMNHSHSSFVSVVGSDWTSRVDLNHSQSSQYL